MSEKDKTRKVNIVAYQDAESWKVAIHLPGVCYQAFTLSPKEAAVLGAQLQGDFALHLSEQAEKVDRALHNLVAVDLFEEIGKQLGLMAEFAASSNYAVPISPSEYLM